MKIYFVRHGETETNRQKRYVGWTDVDLSPTGYEQAEKLSERFAGENISGLYSSDLMRAERTAFYVGKFHHMVPVKSSRLREINFGKWEGLTHDEITKSYSDNVEQWIKDPFVHLPPDGESLVDVIKRAKLFIERVCSSCENDDTVVMVSHGGVIRVLLHSFLNLSLNQFWDLTIDNASVSLVWKEQEEYHVSYINDVKHLQ